MVLNIDGLETRVEPGHLEFIRSRVEDGEEGGKIFCRETGEFLGSYGSSFPSWFRNKDLRRQEVLNIVDKYLSGRPLTDQQTDILEDLVSSSIDEYETCRRWDEKYARCEWDVERRPADESDEAWSDDLWDELRRLEPAAPGKKVDVLALLDRTLMRTWQRDAAVLEIEGWTRETFLSRSDWPCSGERTEGDPRADRQRIGAFVASRRKRKRTEKRIRESIALLSERGKRLSVAAVAREAGITREALNRYYAHTKTWFVGIPVKAREQESLDVPVRRSVKTYSGRGAGNL